MNIYKHLKLLLLWREDVIKRLDFKVMQVGKRKIGHRLFILVR